MGNIRGRGAFGVEMEWDRAMVVWPRARAFHGRRAGVGQASDRRRAGDGQASGRRWAGGRGCAHSPASRVLDGIGLIQGGNMPDLLLKPLENSARPGDTGRSNSIEWRARFASQKNFFPPSNPRELARSPFRFPA